MSRAAVASELQVLIEQIHQLCVSGERLASSSGALVDPKWFRGMQSFASMAMGDLHSKGLMQQPDAAAERVK